MDWKAYTDAIKNSWKSRKDVEFWNSGKILKNYQRNFKQYLPMLSKKHVGRTKPGIGKFSFVTPAVRNAIKKINKLRKNISINRKEWFDACQEARMAIKHA